MEIYIPTAVLVTKNQLLFGKNPNDLLQLNNYIRDTVNFVVEAVVHLHMEHFGYMRQNCDSHFCNAQQLFILT